MRKTTKTIDRGSRDFYQRNRWRRIAKAWLRANPLCVACLVVGKITPAVICDHVHGFRKNDWTDFITSRDLRSLCASCHNRKTASQRGRRLVRDFQIDIGPDGFPLDPRHPCYRRQPASAITGITGITSAPAPVPISAPTQATRSNVRSLSCRPPHYRQAREFKIRSAHNLYVDAARDAAGLPCGGDESPPLVKPSQQNQI